MEFVKPTMAYAEIWPIIAVLGVAVLGVGVEAFVPRGRRLVVQVVLALAGLVAAGAGTVYIAANLDVVAGRTARGVLGAGGSIVVDGPTVFIWGLILGFSVLGVLLFAERRLESGVTAFAGQAAALPGTEAEKRTQGLEHTEVYPLLMFAVGGMLLFPASGDLLTMFVGLEVLSLPLYLMCGLARRRRLLSQEAALKYFMLGAFSSGFFLYGIALTYGFAGSMDLAAIDIAVRSDLGNRTLELTGMALLTVGLLFKVGAVPFQAWTPDVYQGAPTAVTAFMAACTKIAAFGALLRLFYVAYGAERWTWAPVLGTVAAITMLLGVLMAIAQTDVKRMLAYSAIAHTGFLLTGVVGLQSPGDLASGQVTSLQAVMFYLATYAFATVGAFAVVMLVRDASGEATGMDRWAGLGRRSPVVAGVFSLFLLSMAGIPLTAGFAGKWSVFEVAMSAGLWPVVLVAILASVLGVFFYVRQIRVMFFLPPTEASASVVQPSPLTVVVITVGVLGTLFLGLMPGPVMELASDVGQFIR
ncbi:NADH-quinone oxidoreductase subunit NuoN [Nocardioides sp. GY 10127]|uniref:NADH-quinone oxidoreductase subunit NuoN n=1 Tax=Nocardioides sp. GY 10127 TaxID=2569762 RepID=UPI0010A8F7E4|nr:NADH-quinone oxidoreductase subunit NuoN [Nocardioides sp. GY 10127]TIC80083.1 NADH-quinone oxidoreductase subunit NuoN [Nocardioides sp. GY 10127]